MKPVFKDSRIQDLYDHFQQARDDAEKDRKSAVLIKYQAMYEGRVTSLDMVLVKFALNFEKQEEGQPEGGQVVKD